MDEEEIRMVNGECKMKKKPDKSGNKKTDRDVKSSIEIGPYTITGHPPIPNTNQKYVIWIENAEGEGMSVDLDKLWKEWF